MKKQIALTTTMFLLALLALPAYGQGPTIRVNVPFGFSLDDKAYPAGDYAFSALKENVIALEKDGRTKVGLFLANPLSGRSDAAQVRFQCYEQQCFLSQVWIPGLDGGFQSRRSHSETEVAARVAGKYVALLGTSPRQR
jgi:hypothetical protein